MPNLERRLPKLAAIAAPAFVWLAANACDTKTPPQTQSGTEPIPTQSSGTIDTNPQLEPTPGQVTKPAINETNSNLVSIEGNNRYGLRTQVTIGELLETASLLSLRAPEVADTKIFVSAAKLKAEKDPDDPQITNDLLHAANILFAHSQICQDPQAGIREVAKGYAQDIASYLNEHDQTNWEAQKSRFLESPCYWREEEEEQNTTSLVNHNGYEYELYTDVTIDDIIETSNSLPESDFKESIVDALQGAKSLQNINPAHEGIVPSLNRAFNMLDNNCDGDKEKEIANEIASYSRENFPDQYDANSRLYEQGPCSVTVKNHVTEQPTEMNESPRLVAPNYKGGFNLWEFTAAKDGRVYTYQIYDYESQFNLSEIMINAKGLFTEPTLVGYIKDPELRVSVSNRLDTIKNLNDKNPQDPEILDILRKVSKDITKDCDEGMSRAAIKHFASAIYERDPKYWYTHQFEFLEAGCLEAQVTTTLQ